MRYADKRQFPPALNVDEFVDHVFTELEVGKSEIAYGTAVWSSTATPQRQLEIFKEMNTRFGD